MKIVLPCWGLGNVMFQYAFLCELRFRGREACCFLLHKKLRFEHNGYELDKLFKVHPYKGLNIFQRIYIRLVEFLGAMELPYFKLISLFFKEEVLKKILYIMMRYFNIHMKIAILKELGRVLCILFMPSKRYWIHFDLTKE